jgi:hypothetical protein
VGVGSSPSGDSRACPSTPGYPQKDADCVPRQSHPRVAIPVLRHATQPHTPFPHPGGVEAQKYDGCPNNGRKVASEVPRRDRARYRLGGLWPTCSDGPPGFAGFPEQDLGAFAVGCAALTGLSKSNPPTMRCHVQPPSRVRSRPIPAIESNAAGAVSGASHHTRSHVGSSWNGWGRAAPGPQAEGHPLVLAPAAIAE